ANWSGTDTITYQLQDKQGLISNTGTFTFNVHDVNNAPIAWTDNGNTDSAFRMTEDDGSKTIDVRANDKLDDDQGASTGVTISGPVTVQQNWHLITYNDVQVSVDSNNQIHVTLDSAWDRLTADEALDIVIPYTLHGDLPSDVSTANLIVRVQGVNDLPVFN